MIFLNISCEKIIDFEAKETESKIVLYSTLQNDSIITCQLGLSYAVFDARYSPVQIKNAEVKLYKDNTFIENMTYTLPPVVDPNYYNYVQYFSYYKSSSQIPESLSDYKIEVSIPGYLSVNSSAHLPELVNITNIDTQLIAEEVEAWDSEWNYEQKVLEAKIHFSDPPDEDNFYRLVVRQNYGIYPGDKYEPYNSEIPVLLSNNDLPWIVSNDPLLNPAEEDDIIGSSSGNKYNIFSDEKINGKDYELSFSINFKGANFDPAYFEFVCLNIQLQSISKEYYSYLISYSNHTMTDGDFFSEPVLVYSNVENGLGIFGAFNASTNKFKFGEYPIEGVYYEDEITYWTNY